MESKTHLKPRVFIGSSSEYIDVAHAVQTNLEYEFETTVWDQDIFKPSDYSLESLTQELNNTDFSIFLIAPDDRITLRGKRFKAARDNVIFELGLSIGIISRTKTFLMQPRNEERLHIPTDLLGLTPVTYDSNRADKNLVRAVATACYKVATRMHELKKIDKPEKSIPKYELGRTFLYHESGRLPLEVTLDLMMMAKSNVTVFGSTLRAFVARFVSVEDARFMNHVKNLLRNRVDFRFILMDPDSDIVQTYTKDRNVPNLLKETNDSIMILRELMKEFQSFPGQVEVRAYSKIPFSYIFMIDYDTNNGGILFNHYLPATKKANCPYIRLFKSTHPEAFERYVNAIEDTLRTSRKLFRTRGKP